MSEIQQARAAPTDFGVQLLAGMGLLAHDKIDDAIVALEKARAMFPEYGGDDSPYALLAMAYEKKGDTRKQAGALLIKWTSLTETNARSARQALRPSRATRRREGRVGRARPRDVHQSVRSMPSHERLAGLARAAGDKQRVVRERAALVALGPVDRADALYQLAQAQHEVG